MVTIPEILDLSMLPVAHDILEIIGQVGIGAQIELQLGITYRRIDSYRSPAAFPNPFLPCNPLAIAKFDEIRSAPADRLGGISSFQSLWLLGEFGTLIDPVQRQFRAGFPLHVGTHFAPLAAKYFPQLPPPGAAKLNSEDVTRLNVGERPRHRLAPGILLTQPGVYIYGHWILDMVSRLSTLRKMLESKEHQGQPVYYYVEPPFARQFLEVAGVSAERFVKLDPKVIYEAEAIDIPAPVKIDHFVNIDYLGQSLHSFSRAATALDKPFEYDAPLRSPPRRIYFSRAKWKYRDQSRVFANRPQVAEALGQMGFTTVYPEDYSIFQMQRLLQNAEVIVGEDGSALHNIVFAQRSCLLIVLCTSSRRNFWHASLCSAMGQKLAFVLSAPSEKGDIVLIDDLKGVLKRARP